MTESPRQPDEALVGELVRPARAQPAVPPRRFPVAVAALRARVVELARDPVVVASVSAGLAASALRYFASATGPTRGSAGSVVVTGFVLHHVHVVHHVVHHVVQAGGPEDRP